MYDPKEITIKGNWTAMLLPIRADESINYDLLSNELDYLIAAGVDGIYSNGTAGEFYNLTEEEFDKTSQLLAVKCQKAGMDFQIGISHMSPVISLERLRRTTSLKPSAFQVILPDWFVTSEEETLIFLKKMEEEADGIGLVLYNPPHAKRELLPQEFDFLKSKVSGLVGLKVAGGDEEWYKEMNQYCNDLSIFIPGHFLATGLKYGAHGSYSNVACLNPTAAQEWYDMALQNIENAIELEGRINAFMSECIRPLITDKGYSNMAIDKFMSSLGGWVGFGPRMRWPYRSVDESLIEPIKAKGKQIIPEFFLD